MALMDFGLNYA
jgi:CHRD domain-containing protein/PEP-CTERM motif-containing protein